MNIQQQGYIRISLKTVIFFVLLRCSIDFFTMVSVKCVKKRKTVNWESMDFHVYLPGTNFVAYRPSPFHSQERPFDSHSESN